MFCVRVFQASLSIWGWGGLGVVLFLVTFGPFAIFYLAFYIFCFIGGWAGRRLRHTLCLYIMTTTLSCSLILTSVFQGLCGHSALWKDQLRETPGKVRALLLATHTNWYTEGKSTFKHTHILTSLTQTNKIAVKQVPFVDEVCSPVPIQIIKVFIHLIAHISLRLSSSCVSLCLLQTLDEMRLEMKPIKIDRRLTGSSFIDEPLQQVCVSLCYVCDFLCIWHLLLKLQLLTVQLGTHRIIKFHNKRLKKRYHIWPMFCVNNGFYTVLFEYFFPLVWYHRLSKN